MTIADRIDEQLKKQKISRRQLAIKAGIPPSSFQSAMQRDGRMTLEMLQKVANALGAKWYELYSDNEDEQRSAAADFVWDATKEALSQFGKTPHEDEFVEMFKSDVMQKLGQKGVEIQQKQLKEANEKKGLPFFELDKATYDIFVRGYIANLLLAHEIYPKDRKALIELGFTAGDAFAMMDTDDDESDEYADFVDEVAERLDDMQRKSEEVKED